MKKLFAFGIALIVTALAVAGVVSAHGGFSSNDNRGLFHDEMESILESGSYEHLESFRDANNGIGGPRWVVDQDSFETWLSQHNAFEAQGLEGPFDQNPRRGFHRGSGNSIRGFSGGCPFME